MDKALDKKGRLRYAGCMGSHVIGALVENRAGTLSRVSGLFSRRGYNIDSLTVGVTADSAISRVTLAVSGDEAIIDQIIKQLGKLVDVISVRELDAAQCIRREILLVKVTTTAATRPSILEINSVFHGKVVDISTETITIEATGSQEKLDGLLSMLSPFGILELARTGAVALERGTAMLMV